MTDVRGFNSLHVRSSYKDRFSNELNEEEQKSFLSNLLSIDRERRKDMKRCLSIHVGSRWYRAPEISIAER